MNLRPAFLVILLAGLAAIPPLRAEEAKGGPGRVVLRLEPEIDCPGCEERLKALLTRARGVQRVDLDLTRNRIVVRYDPAKCTVPALLGRVAATGYQAKEVK